MTAFWKKNDNKKNDKQSKELTSKGLKKGVVSKNNKKKKQQGMVVPEDKAILIEKTLIKAMISEAVMNAQALGKYTFKVAKRATKKEVALAVEALYGVTVKKVNIINYKSVSKNFRGFKGSTKGYKKAIVTLQKGQEIKLFS